MELDIDDMDAAGLDREKVDALVTRARREVDEGRLPSCQLAVARNGVIGDAGTILDRIAAYIDAGISKFILRPLGDGDADLMAQTRWLVAEVLPEVARRWPKG